MTTQSGHTEAILASRVLGTSVYNGAGEKIGDVKDIMLDKQNNSIMYGVVSFGGFLGMGEKYHPVPWATLNYDADRGGYVVPFTKDQLKAAPAHSLSDLTKEEGMYTARDAAYDYYKVDRYWA